MFQKSLVSVVGLLILFLFIPFTILAFDYVLGAKVYQEGNISKPIVGQTILDENFHTTITRITDAAANGQPFIAPEYVKPDIMNCNGTRILLYSDSRTWYVFDANTSKLVKKLDSIKLGWNMSYNGGDIEPRWDAYDPNIFYYVLPGNGGDLSDCKYPATFNSYNIATDERILLYDFKKDYPGATRVMTVTEGEPSRDGRIWAWFVAYPGNQTNKTTVVVYDKDYNGKNQGAIIKRWDNVGEYGNFISVSPSGQYLIIPHGAPLWTRIYTISGFPNVYHQSYASGHADWGMKLDGTEVIFFADSSNDSICMEDVSTGKKTTVLPIACGGSPYCPSVHFSGNNYNKPGWGVVSTYDPNGLWMDNQVFMVELKENGRVWRLAHSHSVGPNYWAQPHATINREGTKIYFGSNWRNSAGPIDTYQISLPETWYKDLSISVGDIVPPARPTGLRIIK